MRETPPNSVAIAEPNEHERLLGLLGALEDGLLDAFEYQGIQVKHEGESIHVVDPRTGNQLGGATLMESATLNETAEWIKAKLDLYGDR
jgi:hypothetical protein